MPAQLRMGPRVVGLLWDLTMAPGALPEVAGGQQLVDALMAYTGRGPAGIALVWDYLGKCVAQARLASPPHAEGLHAHALRFLKVDTGV